MDSRLFFQVVGDKDLREEIRKRMYPGKKTCNYYDYKCGDCCFSMLPYLIEGET